MRVVRVKPGRYIVIGRLHLPFDNDPLPSYIYRVGAKARAERIALCTSDPHPRRYNRIWQQIMEARKKCES